MNRIVDDLNLTVKQAGVVPETFRQRGWSFPQGGGGKMIEKWCFRALFYQISSDENHKFPPTGGGARCLRRRGCSPLAHPGATTESRHVVGAKGRSSHLSISFLFQFSTLYLQWYYENTNKDELFANVISLCVLITS